MIAVPRPKKRKTKVNAPTPTGQRRGLWIVAAAVIVAVACILAMSFRDPTNQLSDIPSNDVVERARPSTQPNPADTLSDTVAPVTLSLERKPETPVDELVERYDPTADDWDTEVLSDAANTQLKKVSEQIRHGIGDKASWQNVDTILNDDFSCTALGGLSTSTLNNVFDDGTLRVWRLGDAVALPTPEEAESIEVLPQSYQGAAGFFDALEQLIRGLGPGTDMRVKLKVFQIEKRSDDFLTRVLVEASSRSAESGVQQNATWRCYWSYPETEQKNPRLLRISLEAYEQVGIELASGTLFADCTPSVLGRTTAYQQQLLRGIGHWLPRLGRYTGTTLLGHHGLAVGDVNGDGLDDVYVCEPGGLPNRLFVQERDGSATDRSGKAGVDWLEESKSALLIDLDNDGDQDLVVAMPGQILFAENEDQGRFTLQARNYDVSDPTSLCAADYDSDGDLDVYVCGYIAGKEIGGLPLPVPFHDANNGATNVLLRNEGEFRFVGATDTSGLSINNSRFSLAAAWDDYDNDGDQDLYVANDFGRNNLYQNVGGRFTDVAAQAGVEDIATGMSVSWGDYNRDGLMDVYVGNMYSSAGNRVTYQRKLIETQSDQVVAQVQRMARGNTLFANVGDHAFRDVSELAAVTMGRWAWASKFVDLNNDGWQDLVITNGYVTNTDSGDL